MSQVLRTELNRLRELVAARIGRKPSGTNLDEIDTSHWPDPVRELYLAVSTEEWVEACGDTVQLAPVDSLKWMTPDEFCEELSPVDFEPTWQSARFFLFGHGCFGDGFLCCKGVEDQPDGYIVLGDHEENGFVVLEVSLCAWLRRFIEYGLNEYAYVSGELNELPDDRQHAFLSRYVELNPRREWAARRLRELSGANRDTYLCWDSDANMLVPVGEFKGDATDLQLDGPNQRELDSVARDGRCQELMISDGGSLDLSLVSRLARLSEIWLYDLDIVDLAQLEPCKHLTRLEILRTSIVSLHVISLLPKLKYVHIGGCKFDKASLDQVRSERPELKIEVSRA